MCNEVLLKTYIFMSKYTVSELCRIIGISRQTFYNHLKGKYDWRPYETMMLKDLLGLTNEQAALIFMHNFPASL